jgi:Glycosyltransferase like family 2
VRLVFWMSSALLAWTQAGYAAALALLDRLRPAPPAPPAAPELPVVTVVVPAFREEAMIARRIENMLALDYPRDRLEVVVACDGSPDDTPARARAAGADRVLELPRGGKVRAQDAAVRATSGDVVAFSDANALWAPDALRRLVAPFADPRVGYVCGRVAFAQAGGTNQEGLYWRYEMALRALESRLASVTAGNGAIYAVRREAYVEVDPVMGHDLSLPFTLVKRGWRAVEAPEARASERMVPTIEGEWARKRRMMGHTWPIVVRGGLLDPRGYGALYAVMIASHRALRYGSPFLHLAALATAVALARRSRLYALAASAQIAVLIGAVLARSLPAPPLLVCRYYVGTTAAVAAGLWDWLRHGTEPGWDPAEGTR